MEPRRTYLDTHVAAWLYDGRPEMLTATGRQAVATTRLLVSPMVLLELELLREVGKRKATAADVLFGLRSHLGVQVCDVEFTRVIEASLRCEWTRDPFDRLIVGQARAGRGLLLTRDQNLRDNAPEAIW